MKTWSLIGFAIGAVVTIGLMFNDPTNEWRMLLSWSISLGVLFAGVKERE